MYAKLVSFEPLSFFRLPTKTLTQGINRRHLEVWCSEVLPNLPVSTLPMWVRHFVFRGRIGVNGSYTHGG